jgi:hypothetical protein
MLTTYTLLAVAPILGLAAYCLSHIFACQTIRNRGNYFPLVVGCGCGLATTAAISLAALSWTKSGFGDGLALAGINMVAYLAFAFGYFNFINLNIASLRIRMLQELADARGRLPADRLAGLYNTETVIAVRIDRLARGGHLVERGGRYYPGKWQFLFVARTFDLLRWAILGQGTHLALRDGACGNELHLASNISQPLTNQHLAERDEYVEPVSQLSP